MLNTNNNHATHATHEDIQNLLNSLVPLEKKYEKYLVCSDNDIPLFHHPLLVTIHNGSLSPLNKYINENLPKMEKLVQSAFKTGDWHTYIWQHARAYRLQALSNVCENIPYSDNEAFWELLDEVWCDTEFPHSQLGVWEFIFKLSGKSPSLKSKEFCDLPDKLTLYRASNYNGLSWTNKKSVANFFSKRFCNEKITKIKIDKSQITHFTNSRNESEFIIPTKFTNEFYFE